MAGRTDTLLYECPHCNAKVDVETGFIGETVDCPACGSPFAVDPPSGKVVRDATQANEEPKFSVETATDTEQTLIEVHPAMFRERPLMFSLQALGIVGGFAAGGYAWTYEYRIWAIVWAILGLAALGMMIYWWLMTRYEMLTVTTQRTIHRYGIFSKRTNEVQHDDVRNMHVDQSMVDRIFGVGNISISSSGQDDMEIRVRGIVYPDRVADTIRTYQ